MNNKNIIFIICIIGFLEGCINMNNPEDQALYIKCLNSFDGSLVDILPNKIPNNYINLGFSPLTTLDKKNKYAEMHITTRISGLEEYIDLKNQYSNKSKPIYNSMDSCLFIIETYGLLDIGTQGSFECNKLIPVPQYTICKDNHPIRSIKRQEHLEIIVIDYEYKDLLNRPISKIRDNASEYFSAGYSKGVTLDKNNMTIQKWVIVW